MSKHQLSWSYAVLLYLPNLRRADILGPLLNSVVCVYIPKHVFRSGKFVSSKWLCLFPFPSKVDCLFLSGELGITIYSLWDAALFFCYSRCSKMHTLEPRIPQRGSITRNAKLGRINDLVRNAKKFYTMTLVRAKNLQSLKVYPHGSPLERVSKYLCQGQFCTGVYCLHIKKCNLNSLYISSLKQSWILSTVWSPHQSILHPLFHHNHEIREASCFFPLGAFSLKESRPVSRVSQSICLNYVMCMFLSVVSLIWRRVLSHCHSFDFLPGAVDTYRRFNFCQILFC